MPKSKQAAPWCPDECPITGRKFFMWIERAEGGQVPTYGGPYDSFTLAQRDEQGTFWCDRFDHDEDCWTDSIHIDLRLIDNQREDFEYGHVAEVQDQCTALRRALGGMLFAFDDGVGKAWSRDLLDFSRQITPAVEFKP
ncbi:hypothetical protein LVV83_15780 [Pseudomonas sp. LM20]|uniref:hypothetical protein n=1 Tax=Pseudomonas sp. LM20 TaxID=2899116 RepID=UPI001F17CAC2|nr:hypothetical protein [Pseudomonas sp. LM20]MCE5988492.1 hypothetical protein [Pseudomonas sp. LM20]